MIFVDRRHFSLRYLMHIEQSHAALWSVWNWRAAEERRKLEDEERAKAEIDKLDKLDTMRTKQ